MCRFITNWETTMIELFEFPLPVVAAVNGAAAAGGCIMALACDYRVMAEDTLIGMTGIRLGISLPAAALARIKQSAEELRENKFPPKIQPFRFLFLLFVSDLLTLFQGLDTL